MRTEEQKKEAKELSKEYFRESNKRELSNAEGYDKTIIHLVTGTLGFSLLAIKHIVVLEAVSSFCLLYIGWSILFFSMVTALVSYKIGNIAIRKAQKDAIDYYIHEDESAINRENKWKDWNTFTSYTTGFLFLLGVAFILVFVASNIH